LLLLFCLYCFSDKRDSNDFLDCEMNKGK